MMQIQTVTTRSGRQYAIEQDDTLYSQRLSNENLHYQVTNIKFGAEICRAKGAVDTIIDCGMNVGMNTVEYGTFARRVIGFEPTPEIFNLAIQNITHNTLHWDDSLPYIWDWSRKITATIETHKIGLSNQTANVKFISHPKNRGHNHMWNGRRQTKNDMYDVQLKLLDDYAYTGVDYIKIDTEGHELPLLEGAVKTIDANRPVVQCEIVPDQCRRYDYTAEDIWDYFTQRDYRVFTRDGIERTHGIEIKFIKNKRFRIFHHGEEIVRQMDYWFVPSEHAWIQSNPQYKLFA